MATKQLQVTIPTDAVDWDEVKAAGFDADASRAAFMAEVEAEVRKALAAIVEVRTIDGQLPVLKSRRDETDPWFVEKSTPVQQVIDRVLASETWVRES